VTRLEGACMFSLDLPASECYNMNGSDIMKFVIAVIVLIHLLFLHQTRSNNPLGLDKNTQNPIPPLLYSKGHFRICSHNYITNSINPKRTIHLERTES
jgi:hypothetical protein